MKILSKFSRKFFRNLKKRKLKKGTENLQEILGKFYFRLDRILNKICKILEQVLKRSNFCKNSLMKHKIKLRQNKLLMISFLTKKYKY